MSKPTSAPWPTPEWIERIKADDPSDVEAWDMVFRICFQKCQHMFSSWSYDDQYDRALDATAHIIKKLREGAVVRSSLQAFIFQSAANSYKDYLKDHDPFKKAPLQPVLDHDVILAVDVRTTETPIEADARGYAGYDQLMAVLHTCVERLKSEIDRQILRLLRENLSHREIGARLQPPMKHGTVTTRICRVAKKLYPCLVEHGYDKDQAIAIMREKGVEK